MAPAVPSPSKPALRQSTLDRSPFKSTSSDPSRARVEGAAKNNARSPRSKVAPDRVQTDVILAIKPVHLDHIISRRKNHEYRTYRLRDGVERLWLYETRGDGKKKGSTAITHIAMIPPDLRRTPGTVPEEPIGIGNADFNEGKKQSKYGYPILELYQLVKPITLGEMKTRWGMGSAPMGWCYVKAPMWQDRWGDDEEGREDKVIKVF